MPILGSCCRCCTLKTGTLVSGGLGVFIGFSSLMILLFPPPINVRMKTITIIDLPPDIVKIIVAINLFMTMLISILLIVGAIKRNRWLMLPWVMLAIMIIIGLVISIIYTAVTLIIGKSVFLAIWLLVIGLTCNAVFAYLWLVVFSYYQLIVEEKNRGPYGRPIIYKA